MTDVAHLRIAVDSTGARSAAGDLNLMAGAAASAEKGVLGLVGVAATAAAAIGAVFVAGTRSAQDFEKAMAAVNTVLGDHSQLPAMTQAVKDLSEQFDRSPTEQAKALYDIVSAGASNAAEAMDVLSVANKLAVGGVTEVGVAADGLTSVMAVYRDQVKGASDIADKMFISAAVGKTTIGELSSHLGQVAPIAKTAGVSFGELAAAVGALTKGGLSTPQAITGIRSFLSQVIKHSDEASKYAKQIGFDYDVSALKAKGLVAYMEEIKRKTGGGADSIAKLVGDIEGLNATLALTGSAGKDFSEAADAMKESAGKTDEAFQIMADTGEFSFGRLKQQVYGVMMPAFEGMAQEVGKLGKQMSDGLAADPIGAAALKEHTAAIGRNLGGILTDLVAIGVVSGPVAEDFGVMEVAAASLGAVIVVIRDTLNNVVGLVQTVVGGIATAVSGIAMLMEKTMNMSGAYPKQYNWANNWFEGNVAWMEAGKNKIGRWDNLNRFMNPDPLTAEPEPAKAAADSAKTAAAAAREQAEAQRRVADAAKAASDEYRRQAGFVSDLRGELDRLTLGEDALRQIRIGQAKLSPERDREARRIADVIAATNKATREEEELARSIAEATREMERFVTIAPKQADAIDPITERRQKWIASMGQRFEDPRRSAGRELGWLQADRDALDPDTYIRAFRSLRAEASLTWGIVEDGSKDASRAMADYLSSLATGVRNSWHDTVRSVLADLARLATNRTFSALLDMGMQALGGWMSGGAATTTTSYTSPNLQSLPSVAPVSGLGSGGSVGAISVQINMPANGGAPQVTAEGAGRWGQAVGDAIGSKIQDELRPGGSIWEAIRASA